MFKSLYLRSYEDKEEVVRGEKNYFGNPMLEKNIQKLKEGKYDNIDDNGFIKENTSITDKDIIIAKCQKKYIDGKEITTVSGKKINIENLTYWNVELQEPYFSYKEAFEKREETNKK